MAGTVMSSTNVSLIIHYACDGSTVLHYNPDFFQFKLPKPFLLLFYIDRHLTREIYVECVAVLFPGQWVN